MDWQPGKPGWWRLTTWQMAQPDGLCQKNKELDGQKGHRREWVDRGIAEREYACKTFMSAINNIVYAIADATWRHTTFSQPILALERPFSCDQGRLSLSTDGDKCAVVNFGGNEQKSYLSMYCICFIVFLSFSQKIFSLATLARLRFILNLQMQAYNVFYQPHLYIFFSFFGVIIPDCRLP